MATPCYRQVYSKLYRRASFQHWRWKAKCLVNGCGWLNARPNIADRMVATGVQRMGVITQIRVFGRCFRKWGDWVCFQDKLIWSQSFPLPPDKTFISRQQTYKGRFQAPKRIDREPPGPFLGCVGKNKLWTLSLIQSCSSKEGTSLQVGSLLLPLAFLVQCVILHITYAKKMENRGRILSSKVGHDNL